MADPGRPRVGRIFRLDRLPFAFVQAFLMLFLCAIWFSGFAWFWTFMVIELPKDLGPYSQMSSLSMFMHRAFPMRETNDVSFEYDFTHIVCLSLAMATLIMSWPLSRYELEEKETKKEAKIAAKTG